jgi:CshA-type fibril repeat protein
MNKFLQSLFAGLLLMVMFATKLNAQVAPIFQGADDQSAIGNSTSLSVAKPTNLNPGDLVVLVLTTQRSSNNTGTVGFTTPTGFTLIRSVHGNTTTDPEIIAFYKIATGSEPANYTSTVTNNGTLPKWQAVSLRVTGVDPTTPIAISSGATSTATAVATITIPTINTTTANSLLFAARSVRRATTADNLPAGMQEAWNIDGTGAADGDNNSPDFIGAFEAIATASATGTRVFTWTGNARATSLMFAINPAPVSSQQESFTRRQISTTLNNPWELQYGPDNRFWMSENGGVITRMDTSGSNKTAVYTAPDYFGGTKSYSAIGCGNYRVGTFGMALHPDFLSNGYIYYVYTYDAGATVKAKVKRITVNVATGAFVNGSALDIITNIPMGNDHEGLRLMAVKKGGISNLYLTVGDNGVSETNTPACFTPQSNNPNNKAKDLTTMNGKIHKYNMDGSIPSDNPLVGNANGWLPSIWTIGHRNPQGLMYNANSDVFYNIEHGDRTDDEINILQPGKTYGWKDVKGYHDNNYASETAYINSYTPQFTGNALIPAFYAWGSLTAAQIASLSTNNALWPSVAPSDGIYYGQSAIPSFENSLLVVTLKNGFNVFGNDVNPEVYQFQLGADGQSLSNPTPIKYFTADSVTNGTGANKARYRDIATSPDGKKIYLITNNNGAANSDKLIVYEYQPPALPCWSRISERYWINSRLDGGGTIQTGDTVNVALVFNINQGGTGGLNTTGSCNATGTTSVYNFQYKKKVPAIANYVPGTLSIITNRDLIYPGGNTDLVTNLTGSYTDAVDAGDDAYFRGDSALFNIGTGATNTQGGTLTSESVPRQASTRLIAQASMRMIVTASAGSTINLGGGVIRYSNTNGGPLQTYVLPDMFVKVQPNSISEPPLSYTNSITAANFGKFGSPVTTKYSPALPGDQTEFTFIRQTEVYDGEYSIVLQTARDARNTPPTTAPVSQSFVAAPTNTAANVVFYQAATATAIEGGWDVLADHTGATDLLAGNPLYNDNTGSATDGIVLASPPRSAMLMVNGAYAPASIFKDTTRNLVPNTDYYFSFWIRNICNNCHNPTGVTPIPIGDADRSNPGVLPNVAIKFADTIIYSSGTIKYDNPTGTFQNRNTWKKRAFLYSNLNKTQELFSILNFAPGGGGNDFVVDDIVMQKVLPALVNLADPPPPACQGSSFNLNTIVNSEDALTKYSWYKWQTSINNGTSWTDVTTATNIIGSPDNYTASFTTPAILQSDEGRLYRIVVATTSSNLANPSYFEAGSPFRITVNSALGLCLPPVAFNMQSNPMQNNLGDTPLDSLKAVDQDGSISSFRILTIPTAAQGVLRLNGTPVTVNQDLTALQVKQLTFDPAPTFEGNALFTYRATDNASNNSNTASYTIPVFNTPPVANNYVYGFTNKGIANSIPAISGADPEGLLKSSQAFVITSLPSSGALSLNGVPVTIGQNISVTNAANLTFLPTNGSYEGTVNFKFLAQDTLSQKSDTATYTIVVATSSLLLPPVADNIMNPQINNSLGATALNPLLGFDVDGTVSVYTIDKNTIPATAKGVLTYCSTGTLPSCTPTTISQGAGSVALTPSQVSTLSFDPNPSSTDTLRFKYTVTDNSGLISNTATVTIPLYNNPPIANPILASTLQKSDGQIKVPGLSGFDGDGQITSYSITSIPLVADGALYYRVGGAGAITAITSASVGTPKVLTPAEAASLIFDPAITASALSTFNYFVTDNNGLISTSATYTIPMFQLQPPIVRDVLYDRPANTNTSPYSQRYIPTTATWNPADGLFATTNPMTNLNLPLATDADGTILNYQVISVPDRTVEGRLRFPCDATCKTAFTNAGVSLFTQGCSGATPVALSGNNSSVDDCLPVGTQLRTSSYNSNFVEIVGSVTLSPTQMSALQFLPASGFTGTTSFKYSAKDNDGFSGNIANYYIPVSGGGVSEKYSPYALNVINDTIQNTSAARNLVVAGRPAAVDIDGGSIVRYEIVNIPPASQGVLSVCSGTVSGSPATCSGTLVPVIAGQSIPAANIGKLFFDPVPTFLGNAFVSYVAFDDEDVNSNLATIKIPVVSSLGKPISNAIQSTISNINPATSIPSLSATDPSGASIALFEILTLPDSKSGLLTYNNGSGQIPVVKGQTLSVAQAATLQFDPAPGYSGNAQFIYTSTNGAGNESNSAVYTLAITDPAPITYDIVHPLISKNASAFFISTPLSGSDNQAIKSFVLNSIPPASQGTLQYCPNGISCTNAVIGTIIPLSDAGNLKFTPNSTFKGSEIVFNYTAIDTNGNYGNTSNYTFPLSNYSVSGSVFNDPNAGNVDNSTGSANLVPTGMYANLIDNNGKVVTTTTVETNGLYILDGISAGNYTVVLSTTEGTIGNNAPAASVTSGYVNTGEFNGTPNTGNTAPIDGASAIFTVSTANVTNINFGIQQPPTAVTDTLASQVNPGGTTSVTIPSSNFDGNDLSGGTIVSIKITTFPTNTTTITINGTPYNSGNFPVGGVTIPVDVNGNPTQTIAIDPIDGAVTSVITYTATDNGGATSASATVSVPFTTVTIVGSVFNDPNAGNVDNSTGSANLVPSGMYANLIDNNGKVVTTATVGTNGAYTLGSVNGGNYTVVLSTTQGTIGNNAPAASVTSGYVNTGEFNGTPNTGNTAPIDGASAIFTVSTANVTNINFGIQQPPTAVTGSLASQVNPGGTTSVTIPSSNFDGNDLSGGTIVSIKITTFPTNATTITINGTPYNSGNFPVGGVIIPADVNGNPTQTIAIDPIDGAVTSVITYTATDNGGATSASATVSVPFTTVTIVGSVFNDPNAGNVDNSTGSANLVPSGMYANLIDNNGKVVTTTTVGTNGSYTLGSVNGGDYTVVLSTTQGTIGNNAPAASVPTGYINTGEFNGTPNTGNTAPIDGASAIFTVSTANITNINFGIQQPPVASNDTSIGNIGQPVTVNVLINDSDVATGTIDPTSVTMIVPLGAIGVVTDGNGDVTSMTIPGEGTWTVNPTIGEITFTPLPTFIGNPTPITYTVDDNAGFPSNPATVTITYPSVIISGTVINDVNGSGKTNGGDILTGSETGTTAGTNLYVYLIDNSGKVIDSAKVQFNGTYTLVGSPNSTYTIELSTTQYAPGININTTPISNTPPSGWATIGEGASNQGDGISNGTLTVSTDETNSANNNFGIVQKPIADDKFYSGLEAEILRFNPTGNASYPNEWNLNNSEGTNDGPINVSNGTMPGLVSGNDINSGRISGATGSEGDLTFTTNGRLYDPLNPLTLLPSIVLVYKANGDNIILNPSPSPLDPSFIYWNSTTNQFEIPNFNANNLSVWFDTTGSSGFLFNYGWKNGAGVESNKAIYSVTADAPLAILPVELVYFTGSIIEDAAVLTWLTASELNNSGFEIEHSMNGIDFESIGWVNGNGSSNIPHTYGYKDQNLSLGVNYYRLKQIDYDGKVSYSQIISLEYKTNLKVSIYPVPALNILNVNINLKDLNKVQLTIVDVSGRRIRTVLNVNASNQIDLSNIPNGSYFLQVNSNNNQLASYPFSIIK